MFKLFAEISQKSRCSRFVVVLGYFTNGAKGPRIESVEEEIIKFIVVLYVRKIDFRSNIGEVGSRLEVCHRGE